MIVRPDYTTFSTVCLLSTLADKFSPDCLGCILRQTPGLFGVSLLVYVVHFIQALFSYCTHETKVNFRFVHGQLINATSYMQTTKNRRRQHKPCVCCIYTYSAMGLQPPCKGTLCSAGYFNNVMDIQCYQ